MEVSGGQIVAMISNLGERSELITITMESELVTEFVELNSVQNLGDGFYSHIR